MDCLNNYLISDVIDIIKEYDNPYTELKSILLEELLLLCDLEIKNKNVLPSFIKCVLSRPKLVRTDYSYHLVSYHF